MADPGALAPLSDEGLAAALGDLAPVLAVPVPVPGADPARLARLRIESGLVTPPGWRARSPGRGRWRVRRSLALALIAVAVLAAIAGAIGFGLPGVRILPGGSGVPLTPTSPASSFASPGPASPRPVGATLGLGAAVTLDSARATLDFPILLPSDPATGAPAAVWMLERRVTLAWPPGASLPALRDPSVGLLLSQFRGSVDSGYFEKILNPQTRIEPVTVRGVAGWWISGEPHGMVFVTPGGDPWFDSRRIAGDTLLWSSDGITYRLESALGREATLRLADSLR